MSISVMKEGEVMGRGVKNPTLEARTRARAKAADAFTAPVAILGAGPAGLLAAHAVALAGGDPVIFSAPGEDGNPVKSELSGAIFLHEPVPDLTGAKPDGVIRFVKVGTREGYALKVYGSRFAPCSWDRFDEGDRPAWALQPVYEELWKRYSGNIVPIRLDHELAQVLVADFPSIVSTVPAPALCKVKDDGRKQHSFASRPIWIVEGATAATHAMMEVMKVDNLIVYDGSHPNFATRYRASIIFGHASTEFTHEQSDATLGMKILRPTDCDCHPDIVRAGRWGCWKPGVLAHHAFQKVWDMMFNEFEGAN